LKIAIEKVDLPINSMVVFHSELLVYQRVTSVSKGKLPCHKRAIPSHHHVFLCGIFTKAFPVMGGKK
jgi:hypothetical protein